MRKFSPKEQLLIRKLVFDVQHSQLYLPINLFDDIFIDRQVGLDLKRDAKTGEKKNAHPELLFYRDTLENETDEILDITREIAERIFVIDYLKKEGLIIDIEMCPDSYKVNINYSDKGKYLISSKIDDKIADLLFLCANKVIIISETLIDLCNNNFKSLEEQMLEQAEKQTSFASKQADYARKQAIEANKQTVYAQRQFDEAKIQTRSSIIVVIVSILGIIVSVVVDFCSRNSNDVKEKEQALVGISQSVSSIDSAVNNKLDSSLCIISEGITYSNSLLEDTLVVKMKK